VRGADVLRDDIDPDFRLFRKSTFFYDRVKRAEVVVINFLLDWGDRGAAENTLRPALAVGYNIREKVLVALPRDSGIAFVLIENCFVELVACSGEELRYA
jgi:hypothetical protein